MSWKLNKQTWGDISEAIILVHCVLQQNYVNPETQQISQFPGTYFLI